MRNIFLLNDLMEIIWIATEIISRPNMKEMGIIKIKAPDTTQSEISSPAKKCAPTSPMKTLAGQELCHKKPKHMPAAEPIEMITEGSPPRNERAPSNDIR